MWLTQALDALSVEQKRGNEGNNTKVTNWDAPFPACFSPEPMSIGAHRWAECSCPMRYQQMKWASCSLPPFFLPSSAILLRSFLTLLTCHLCFAIHHCCLCLFYTFVRSCQPRVCPLCLSLEGRDCSASVLTFRSNNTFPASPSLKPSSLLPLGTTRLIPSKSNSISYWTASCRTYPDSRLSFD